jgi:tetratricopeptide (TPR) repeat protein
MSRQAADELVSEAHTLFQGERFPEALAKFERAVQIFPEHALGWKGLGHCLLSLGRPVDAARAFDRSIGIRGDSATALWGGAVAYAELGNKLMAQTYLRRTLALQPTWIEMARGIPMFAQLLQPATRAADLLRGLWGTFSTRAYRHADDESRSIEVGRIANQPRVGAWTYATIGLSNKTWAEPSRPHVELVLATMIDGEICGQILANLAFHLQSTNFFPQPGVLVRDVIGALSAGDLSQRLPHVFIGIPRAWKLKLPLHAGPPAITLAQVIPVSEPEYVLWRENPTGFELSFVERGIDVFDLRRRG